MPEVDDYGTKYYKNIGGQLHREGGPAIVNLKTGYEEWYINGKLHRDDGGPAITRMSSIVLATTWYIYDKLHRVNGPAHIQRYSGHMMSQYYINGVGMSEYNHNAISKWMTDNNIQYPFNEDDLLEFKLRLA